MLKSGTYIAVFALSQRCHLHIGRLGWFSFAPGLYLYAGSAQRNLSARLERHARQAKRLRWHIDYLAAQAVMIGAIIVPGPRERECELARGLTHVYQRVIPGFGASDCGCGGHLFYTPKL
jgi:sugar fermentation stimulation protein A